MNGFARDETPRAGTSLEKMAGLEPLTPGGRITAAVSSQIVNGPSFTSSTAISAPNRPVSTRMSCSRSEAANRW